MQCEKCGSDVWDNTQKNQQRVANGQKPFPQFKCRDQSCGWVKWPPKNQGGGAQAQSGANGGTAGDRARRPLGPLYFECMKVAVATVKKWQPNASPADVVAATATLFIGATNTGAPVIAPAPPKPKPAPPPSNDFDAEPDGIAEEDFDRDTGLPF